MLNVVSFRQKARLSRESRPECQPAHIDADIPDLVSRIGSLQTKAKGEIRDAILMLDLAAQHARQISRTICDPAAKANFDERLAMIEEMLQTARSMALKL